jgi:hypothetical protein
MTNRWRRREKLIAAGAGGVLAVVLVAWAVWPASEVEPRAREYRDVTACLLTDRQGVAGAEAAPVWAGMQAASARTHGQVRYLAVTGDQSATNAQAFAGTLLAGRCAVIVAAPGIADNAVRALAGRYPAQQFLVVGGASPATGNVTRLASSSISDTTAQVSTAVGDRLAADD